MKFGVREICDVVFKTTANNQRVGKRTFAKAGMPAFMIDTARTSSLEQATTTVYAQGGKGYNRLIAWEGEKTMTFTVEDALISPVGLAVLTGAGLIEPPTDKNFTHAHCTINLSTDDNGEGEITLNMLKEETYLDGATKFTICKQVPAYATALDGSGAGIDFYDTVTFSGDDAKYVDITDNAPVKVTIGNTVGSVLSPAQNKTVQVDFYLLMNNTVTEVTIEPGSFGGYYYVEAQTLYRREDTGKDMAAELILPKVKVQSGFTFTMAASGDPSTFTFTMDAFPGYTRFDKTKKVMCVMQILGSDSDAEIDTDIHEDDYIGETPSFKVPDPHTPGLIDISGSAKVGTSTIPAGFPYSTEYQANQGAIKRVAVDDNGDLIVTLEADSLDSLEKWTSTDPGQAALGDQDWLAIDIATGTNDITQLTYGGYALTDADVADAAAWGLGDGHIILWIRAAAVAANPKAITLGGDDFETLSFNLKVEEEV